MKKNILIGLFILSFSFITLQVVDAELLNSKTRNNRETAKEISNLIDKFWSASLEGNKEIIDDLIINTPTNFYKVSCEENFINKTPISNFSQADVSMNRLSVTYMANDIRENKIERYNIISQKNNLQESVVKIEFGYKDDEILFKKLNILLGKEENTNQWKIFKVAADWQIDEINKNFGDSNCNKNEIN